MGSGTKIIKNSSLLFLARAANLAATFAIGIYIAKFSGVAPYGEFSFVMTFFFLFSVVFSLGLGTIISREVAKYPEKLGDYFSNATFIGILSSLVGLVAMVSASFLFNLSTEGRHGLYVLSLSIVPSSLTFIWESILITFERSDSIFVVQLIETALKVILAYMVLESGYGMVGLMAVFLVTRLMTGILYLFILHKMVNKTPTGVSADSVRSILSLVPTFAGLYIFSVLFSKIDLMMLSLMKNFNDVGIYSAAYKLLEISFILPTCVVTVMFPLLSRWANETPDTIGRTSCRAALYSTLALIPVVVLAMIFAGQIMCLVYSKGFIDAVVPFRILIVTLGLYMIDQIFAHTLVACNYQQVNLTVIIAGTVLNLLINIVLIPHYSYIGASIATLISMLFVAAMHFYYVRKYLFGRRALEIPAL